MPVAVALAVTCAAYALMLRPQIAELQLIRQQKDDARLAVAIARKASIQANIAYVEMLEMSNHLAQCAGSAQKQFHSDVEMLEMSNHLAQAETIIASGDVYSWVVKAVESLKEEHGVQINHVDAPDIRKSVTLPTSGYEDAHFSISGRARYHDFGMFLAAFENHYVFARLKRLDLTAPGASRGGYDEGEELRFTMEVTMPVGPRIGGGVLPGNVSKE